MKLLIVCITSFLSLLIIGCGRGSEKDYSTSDSTSISGLTGDSLKIIKMQRMVNKEFNVGFTIDKFFEYITIRDIATALDQENITSQDNVLKEKEIELILF